MKTKSKQRLKSAVSILLMLAIVITGAFAYFTATDSKKNVFTIGNVDIVLHEDDWTEPDANGDSQHIDGDNINVLPGDKISKAPYIENTGDNNAWVYMTIGIPTIQRDTSRADDLAISFTNTNIPVEAYALQEGYGNVDGSQAMWDAYFADKSDDKFGTAVTDESALLNRVELFNLPNIDSSWTQLGEVFKSEDGFNYYVFAYNDVIEPTSNTTPVIEWVQLNPALTQNDDVLFSPDAASVAYFVKNDIGEAAAQEIYGAQADYEYAGAIELDYVPEQDDAYYVSNADALLTFNATSSQWEVESTEENPVDADLIPDTILNKTATVIDPQADPDPDHAAPKTGDEYEDDDYIYKYGYRWFYSGDKWTTNVVNGWGVRVKDDTKTSYGPMKNEIWGKPVVSAEATFYECDNLISVAGLSQNLTNMTHTFMGCNALVESPKIPNSVTNMQGTFYNCPSLVKTPVFPSSLKSLYQTFRYCDNLTQVEPIPESVTDMMTTFQQCSSLTEAPIIPKNVTNMDSTFKECTSLMIPPVIPESVTSLSGTFWNCTSLTTVPEIPENVTNMSSTFYNCTLITIAPEIPNSVTNMGMTFCNCTSLTKAPKIPDSVTDMDRAFEKCTSLINPPDMSDATGVTDMSNAFNSCTSLVYPPDLSNATNVEDLSQTFSGCKSLTNAPEIPSRVTDMSYTFYNCSSLTVAPTIPEGVTDMSRTFQNCTSLTTAPEIPNGVTNMEYTFYGCTSLTEAPIIIPSSVVNMNSTFRSCSSLTSFPDMTQATNVENMNSTFYGCASITGTIRIPAGVTTLTNCFYGTSQPITMEYYSSCTAAVNYSYKNVTKVCLDA